MNTQNEPKPSQIDIPLFKDEQGKEQPFLYFANLKFNTTDDDNFVIIQSPQDYTQDEIFSLTEKNTKNIQDKNEMMKQYHFKTNFLKTTALIAKTIIYRKDYDEEENENYKMVSYSVPNPCTLNVFNNLELINGNLNQPTEYYYTEMVEGIMMTLFHDGDKWEIATRSNIGGNYSYFQNKYELPINNLKNYEASLITEIFSGQVKTFQQMFYEALFNEELNGDFHEELNAKLTENNIFTNYCYTFVVQHPAHSFVAVFETPKIYLLSVSQIKQLDEEYDDWKYNITIYDAECMHHKNRNNYSFVKQLTDAFKSVKFPKQDFIKFGISDKFTKFTSYDHYEYHDSSNMNKTFIEFFVEKYKNNPLNQNRQGIIVYSLQPNSDFKHRMMVFTDTYLHKMQLRTNHPNFQYTYFELLKNQNMGEFLYNFPQFQTLLTAFHTQFEKFVEVLFKLYKVYVANAKSKVKTQFPHKFHKHIIALHDLYKQKNYGTTTNNEKNTKFIINDNVVRNYLLGLEVSYLINSLNYEINLQTQLPETLETNEEEDA